jgi:hypothetical protein
MGRSRRWGGRKGSPAFFARPARGEHKDPPSAEEVLGAGGWVRRGPGQEEGHALRWPAEWPERVGARGPG